MMGYDIMMMVVMMMMMLLMMMMMMILMMMTRMWTNFVKYGDPTPPGWEQELGFTWEPVTSGDIRSVEDISFLFSVQRQLVFSWK